MLLDSVGGESNGVTVARWNLILELDSVITAYLLKKWRDIVGARRELVLFAI